MQYVELLHYVDTDYQLTPGLTRNERSKSHSVQGVKFPFVLLGPSD